MSRNKNNSLQNQTNAIQPCVNIDWKLCYSSVSDKGVDVQILVVATKILIQDLLFEYTTVAHHFS